MWFLVEASAKTWCYKFQVFVFKEKGCLILATLLNWKKKKIATEFVFIDCIKVCENRGHC